MVLYMFIMMIQFIVKNSGMTVHLIAKTPQQQ